MWLWLCYCCEKWESVGWDRRQFGNSEEGNFHRWKPLPNNGLWRLKRLYICCSYIDLWSMNLSESQIRLPIQTPSVVTPSRDNTFFCSLYLLPWLSHGAVSVTYATFVGNTSWFPTSVRCTVHITVLSCLWCLIGNNVRCWGELRMRDCVHLICLFWNWKRYWYPSII